MTEQVSQIDFLVATLTDSPIRLKHADLCSRQAGNGMDLVATPSENKNT